MHARTCARGEGERPQTRREARTRGTVSVMPCFLSSVDHPKFVLPPKHSGCIDNQASHHSDMPTFHCVLCASVSFCFGVYRRGRMRARRNAAGCCWRIAVTTTVQYARVDGVPVRGRGLARERVVVVARNVAIRVELEPPWPAPHASVITNSTAAHSQQQNVSKGSEKRQRNVGTLSARKAQCTVRVNKARVPRGHLNSNPTERRLVACQRTIDTC